MNTKTTKYIFAFFALCFGVIVLKAFRLQVIDKNVLLSKYNKQIFRENKVYPNRGNILDRDNNPLALNRKTYSIFAIPSQVEMKNGIKKLAKIVNKVNAHDLRKKLKKRNRFTWVARKIQLKDKEVEAIKKLKGVYIEQVPKRFYPNGSLLGQTLGFVGVDNKGLAGIEHSMDKELIGGPKIIKFIKDAKGRPIKFEVEDPGVESKDIKLTIRKDLQAVSEKILAEAVIEHKALKGGVGVMDASTGEILAMANYPTFNPNDGLSKSEVGKQRLSFISDPIEPGSIMKTFTVASAFENKIAKEDTSYYCEQGRLVLDGHVINEAETKKKPEWLSVREILKYSSNVGTTKIAFDLGQKKMISSFQKFGFGKKTEIPISGESRGIFEQDKKLSAIKFSNVSFGQGIATTGIQMLSAYSALANNGLYNQPKIFLDQETAKPERVLSEETSKKITDILIDAVESGTGGNAKIKYFQIAGKTSTAQRPDSQGKYNGYISGFIGYPVNVKRPFVIYVYIEKPENGTYYGNTVAAPVFRKIAEYMLFKNKDIQNLPSLKITAKKQRVDIVQKRDASRLKYSKGIVPNFVGRDKKSILRFAKLNNLKIIFNGMGVVNSQFPEAGATLKSGQSITLRLKLPSYEN
jgi:cell division protein FtsI (penicillin-binding protein 3)